MVLPDSHPHPFEVPTRGQTRRLWPSASGPVYVPASAILAAHQSPSYRGALHQVRSNRNRRLSMRGYLRRRCARPIPRTLQLLSNVARVRTNPDRRLRLADAHAFAPFLPAAEPGSCVMPHYPIEFEHSWDAMINPQPRWRGPVAASLMPAATQNIVAAIHRTPEKHLT